MVVIRIKDNDDNKIPKKISGGNIKIVTNLKSCKLAGNDIDEKIEKEIAFIISSKPGDNIEYNEANDEYTIFGLQQHSRSSSDMDLSYKRYKFTKSSGRWKR